MIIKTIIKRLFSFVIISVWIEIGIKKWNNDFIAFIGILIGILNYAEFCFCKKANKNFDKFTVYFTVLK